MHPLAFRPPPLLPPSVETHFFVNFEEQLEKEDLSVPFVHVIIELHK